MRSRILMLDRKGPNARRVLPMRDLVRPNEHMRKIPTMLVAAIWGVAIESALCVVAVVSVLAGGFGPCGPTGDVPGFVRVIHQPGFWVSSVLVGDYNLISVPLAVMVTTVLLSVVAFVVLRLVRGTSEVRPEEGG